MISQILAGLFLLLWAVASWEMYKGFPSYQRYTDYADVLLGILAGLLITVGISLMLGLLYFLGAIALGII